MEPLVAFMLALAISMAVIPPMARLAPRLGMIDRPGGRKIHAAPTPRVGGIGVVAAVLVPIVFLVPLNGVITAYLLAVIVLAVFSVWDDVRELGCLTKLVGQVLAAGIVVFYGGLYVQYFPLVGLEPVAKAFGVPFTLFAIVGVINAVNQSDGLDGLAGGLVLMSAGAVALLAYLADSYDLLVVSLAVIGGIVGFLRYNAYPARVFLGDLGSQFLGLSIGVMVVILSQQAHRAASPAIVLALLGLPLLDSVFVMAQRIAQRRSIFKADRNHIHHWLLALGLDQYESVVLIYSAQAVLVISALFMVYESDWLNLGYYLGFCVTFVGLLSLARSRGWRLHDHKRVRRLARVAMTLRGNRWLVAGPVRAVAVVIPAYLLVEAVSLHDVPRDFGLASAAVLLLLLPGLLLISRRLTVVIRVAVYTAAAFVVYLGTYYPPDGVALLPTMEIVLFACVMLAIWLAVRYSRDRSFQTTPTDYLVLLVLFGLELVAHNRFATSMADVLLLKVVIVFYACELLITYVAKRWSALSLASLAALAVIAVRGLLL